MTCVTVGTTIKFNLGDNGWSYFACTHCNKKTNQVSAFKCNKCDKYNDNHVLKLVH